MKSVILIIALFMGALASSAQGGFTVYDVYPLNDASRLTTTANLIGIVPARPAYLPAAPARPDTAQNVVVGPYNVLACYPDAEFLLSFQHDQLRVTQNNLLDEGSTEPETRKVVIKQVTEGVFRAEICRDSWVEVNVAEGTTTVKTPNHYRVFTPPVR